MWTAHPAGARRQTELRRAVAKVTYFGGVSDFGFFGAPFFLVVDFFAGGLVVSA